LLALQLVQDPLEFVQFLTGFAEFTFGGEVLIIGEGLGGAFYQFACGLRRGGSMLRPFFPRFL
jgi:hypothetical protein